MLDWRAAGLACNSGSCRESPLGYSTLSCLLKNVATISALAAELTTFLRMLDRTSSALYLGGAVILGLSTELVR